MQKIHSQNSHVPVVPSAPSHALPGSPLQFFIYQYAQFLQSFAYGNFAERSGEDTSAAQWPEHAHARGGSRERALGSFEASTDSGGRSLFARDWIRCDPHGETARPG